MPPKNEAKRSRSGSGNTDEPDAVLEDLITNFKMIEKPGVKDLSDFLIHFLQASNNLNTRFNNCEDRLTHLENRCALKDTHIQNIEDQLHEVEENQASLKCDLESQISDLNVKLEAVTQQVDHNSSQTLYMQQLFMDKDIILKGFPTKPDPDIVLKNFVEHFDLNLGQIREHYYVNYTKHKTGNSNDRSLHFVVISFKSKSTKVEVFKKKKAKGSLLLKNVLPDDSTNANTIIKCSNKLTKFNLYVQHIMYKAQEMEKIAEYKYHNYLFQYKLAENEKKWIRIDTYEKIKEISRQVYKI